MTSRKRDEVLRELAYIANWCSWLADHIDREETAHVDYDSVDVRLTYIVASIRTCQQLIADCSRNRNGGSNTILGKRMP